MAHYFIEVKGEIFSRGGLQYAQGWVCGNYSPCATDPNYVFDEKFLFDKETHTVNSNLILTENRRAVPYALYFTDNGIATNKENGDKFFSYPGFGAALGYYKENIGKISNILNCSISKEFEQTLFHGLFTEIFSILELFLSDFILCMIYSNEAIYEKAVIYYKSSKRTLKETPDIEKKVHNFFFNGVVYHRFEKVKQIYERLLDISFPNSDSLIEYLHKRNNIVHRFSFSNIDRMEIITITKEMVVDLIKRVNLFVDNLVDNVKAKYPNP